MKLSPAQLATLKTYILNNADLQSQPLTPDGDAEIARLLNLSTADFWVWRTSVPAAEYVGANGIVWTEVDALSVGKARIFEWLTGNLTRPINAADPNVRGGIADAFGAGTATRANLTNLGKRLATRAEQQFATGGTGTNVSPATMSATAEGPITEVEVSTARRLP